MKTAAATPRQLLAQALQIDIELDRLPKLPKTRLQNSDLLTTDEIKLAVRAVRLCLDLPSCNSGGRNLYDLLDLYLRNPEARGQINAVIRGAGHPVH